MQGCTHTIQGSQWTDRAPAPAGATGGAWTMWLASCRGGWRSTPRCTSQDCSHPRGPCARPGLRPWLWQSCSMAARLQWRLSWSEKALPCFPPAKHAARHHNCCGGLPSPVPSCSTSARQQQPPSLGELALLLLVAGKVAHLQRLRWACLSTKCLTHQHSSRATRHGQLPMCWACSARAPMGDDRT